MLRANAMSAQPPLLSVIVVCKNPGPRLAAALASVWEQRWVEPEIVVVDGASTDGTRGWLESHRDRLAVLISEPDAGVYDAMNKAVAAASGEWILFLGADDRLVGDTLLSEVLPTLQSTEAGVAAGEAAYDDGRIYQLASHVHPLVRNFVHHQSTFYRRALFDDFGRFDLSFTVAADYELNLRLWKSHVRFKPLPLRIAACAVGGLSDGGRWRVYAEEIRVRHRYAHPWKCWFWDALSIARFIRKQPIRVLRKLRRPT